MTQHPPRITFLDGFRAIAILLVILDHYVPRILDADNGPLSAAIVEASGWSGAGVDLFFVLSGFLITGILVDSKGSKNFFLRFYWRRSVRIFPAFYAFLGFMLLFHRDLFQHIRFPWFALYARNLRGSDPTSDSILGHLWSLAVEEQFYIGWAIAVFFCSRRRLTQLTLLLIVLAPLTRAGLHFAGIDGYRIFRVTPARMDSLLFGSLIALAIRSGWAPRLPKLSLIGLGMALAGLVLLRIVSGGIDIGILSYQFFVPTLIPLLFASLLGVCLHLPQQHAAIRFLSVNPLRVIAKYSYAIYLWHLFAAALTAFLIENTSPLLNAAYIPIAFALSFGMAVLSWYFIESPALRQKDRFFSN